MNAAAYIVIGALLLFGGKWEMPAIFQKKPPVAQLTAAQQELAAAKAAQATAEAALAAAQAARQAQTEAQLDYTQQMVAGTALALHQVPTAAQTPEVKLAAEFSARAEAGFEAARGRLSAAQRAEIESLFTAAIAAKNTEVESLRAALEHKDADLAATISAKAAVERQLPTLQSDLAASKAEVTVKDAKATTLTEQVKVYAEQTAAERAKNGSLDAYAGNLVRIIIALAVLYGLVHWLLPCLAQSYTGVGWLQTANNLAKNITTAHL